MKKSHVSQVDPAAEGPAQPSSGGTLALLEHEIAELRELNAHLQRRLAETETQAELRARAFRILAILPPEGE